MFERSKQGVVDVIRGDNALNQDGIEALRRVISQLDENGQPNVILDMQRIPLINSAGLEYLLDLFDQFRAHGGTLKLLAPNPLVSEVLSVTGVEQFFEIFADEVSAVGSFTR